MLKKLRMRFVWINMTLLTILLCIILALVVHFTAQSLAAESSQLARSLANSPQYGSSHSQQLPQAQLPYFVVFRNLLGSVDTKGYYDLSDQDEITEIIAAVDRQTKDEGLLKEYNLRYCRKAHPTGQKIVLVDVSSERSTVSNLFANCVFIGLASFSLLLMLSLWLSSMVIRPVERAWQQQKQFVSDASHELKTPLTVITTNAELLQSTQAEGQPDLNCVENILTTSRQMRRLVESMLELARADNGSLCATFSEVNLGEALQTVLLPFDALFFEHGMELDSDLGSSIVVWGSEPHLGYLLVTLLDNALQYSDANARVSVRLTRQGKYAQLTVTNPGPAIEGEDLKKIFQRFYRVNPARTGEGNYGLGLSIAARIVLEHQGKIWAESKDGYNTFFVLLPIR